MEPVEINEQRKEDTHQRKTQNPENTRGRERKRRMVQRQHQNPVVLANRGGRKAPATSENNEPRRKTMTTKTKAGNAANRAKIAKAAKETAETKETITKRDVVRKCLERAVTTIAKETRVDKATARMYIRMVVAAHAEANRK